MPLVRIDAVEGHSETEAQTLLHAAHRAMLGAFGVLPRDRILGRTWLSRTPTLGLSAAINCKILRVIT